MEEYLRAGTETLPETYTGTLDQADAQFVVTTYENGSTTDDRTIPGGPSIPPRTIYLLSEGTSSNGTKRRAGALFRTGMGEFDSGVVVLETLVASGGSVFDAYNSAENPDPTISKKTGQSLLANNGDASAEGAKQFELGDSKVEGAVFVAPGFIPAEQIQSDDPASLIYRTGVLSEKINIDDIVFPDLDGGGGLSGGSESGATLSETEPTNLLYDDHNLSVQFQNGKWDFVHSGSTITYDPATQSYSGGTELSGGWWKFSTMENIKVNSDGTISYRPGDGLNPDQDLGPFGPYSNLGGIPESADNPVQLEPGNYDTVTIDTVTTELVASADGAIYRAKTLAITADGILKLPDTGGKTRIYVTDKLVVDDDAILNDTQLPPNLTIYYTGTDPVTLGSNSKAYFTLFAPNAKVSFGSSDGDRSSFTVP